MAGKMVTYRFNQAQIAKLEELQAYLSEETGSEVAMIEVLREGLNLLSIQKGLGEFPPARSRGGQPKADHRRREFRQQA